jgi:hypothetical protein
MLKSYLLAKLSDLFGQYVDGIDDESLEVGVWSGKIQLKDVKLRKEAMDKLRLPLAVRGGYLRQLDVEWSWTGIGSTPVKVKVDTVNLLLCPNNATVHATADDLDRTELYETLGIDRAASTAQIEEVFAALAEKHHPAHAAAEADGATAAAVAERWGELVEAYEVPRGLPRRPIPPWPAVAVRSRGEGGCRCCATRCGVRCTIAAASRRWPATISSRASCWPRRPLTRSGWRRRCAMAAMSASCSWWW